MSATWRTLDTPRTFQSASQPATRPPRPYNVADPELLYIHRPHLRLTGTQPSDIAATLCLASAPYRYEVRYDRQGFRNEGDLTSAEIAVIGDSFIEAPTVSDSKS